MFFAETSGKYSDLIFKEFQPKFKDFGKKKRTKLNNKQNKRQKKKKKKKKPKHKQTPKTADFKRLSKEYAKT